jgi:exosortase/archaeosortase family protein
MRVVMSIEVENSERIARRSNAPSLLKAIAGQRHWFLILLPLIVILIYPLRWCSAQWFSGESQWYFQPWAIVLALLWIALRHEALTRTLNELAELFPDPNSAQRRGNLSIVVLGLLTMLFAYIAAMPPLAIFSLILLIVGILFYLYGPFLVRSVSGPLLLLLLGIPWPSSITSSIVEMMQRRAASVVGQTLSLFGVPVRALGTTITFSANNYTVNVTPSYSGLGVFFFVLLTTFWWTRVHRVPFVKTVAALALAIFVVCITNILRLVIVVLAGRSSSETADGLYGISALPAILIDLIVLYVAIGWLVKSRIARGPHALQGPSWLGGSL